MTTGHVDATYYLEIERRTELYKVLPRAKMNIWCVVPFVGNISVNRHSAANRQLNAVKDMREVGEVHHCIPADPDHLLN